MYSKFRSWLIAESSSDSHYPVMFFSLLVFVFSLMAFIAMGWGRVVSDMLIHIIVSDHLFDQKFYSADFEFGFHFVVWVLSKIIHFLGLTTERTILSINFLSTNFPAFPKLSGLVRESTMLSMAIICGLAKAFYFRQTYSLFKRSSLKQSQVLLWVVFVFFAIPPYMPFWSPHFFIAIGTQNVWHNPTFICLWPFYVYFLLNLKSFLFISKEKLLDKQTMIFSAMLLVATWIKPSFTVAILPAVAIYELFGLRNGLIIRKVGYYLCMFLPSIISLLIQFHMLSIASSKALSHQGHIIFAPFLVMKMQGIKYPILTFLQVTCLPFLLLVYRYFDSNQVSQNSRFCIIFFLVSYCFWALFAQSGNPGDGNFGWVYLGGIGMLYLSAISDFISCRHLGGRLAMGLIYPLSLYMFISGITWLFAYLFGLVDFTI